MTDRHAGIDFSRYVAIGDSITAGYADGALQHDGQVSAYPALLAAQYQLLYPLDFRQPLVHPSSAGLGFNGRSRLILEPDEACPENPWGQLNVVAPEAGANELPGNIYGLHGPFHNFAVPGAKTAHLLMPGYGNPARGTGNFNPFFWRMASDAVNTSVFQDILQSRPTFFTLLIGNNDILAYAMTGGTQDAITPYSGPLGSGFAETFSYLVDVLCQSGAKGVLCTLPDPTNVPFFNTIRYNSLLLEKDEARELNTKFGGEPFQFKTGRNCFVVEDTASGLPQLRQLGPGELILCELMQDVRRRDYLSGRRPLPKQYYLNSQEVKAIKTAIGAYNSLIERIAEKYKLGLVDLGALIAHLKPDRYYDARVRAIRYLENGVFSLDGIHINALGQALLANEFIKTIFRRYGLKIPRLPIVRFRKKYGRTYR